MLRHILYISPLAALAVAACTQAQAPVDLKGQSVYGRGGASGYASGNTGYAGGGSTYQAVPAAPVESAPAAPVQNVGPASSIGVSDIGAPSSSGPRSSAEPLPDKLPFKLASSEPAPQNRPQVTEMKEIQPQQTDQAPAPKTYEPANAWTQKPRFSDSDMPTEEPGKPVQSADNSVTPAASSTATENKDAGFRWPVGSKKILSGFGPKGGGRSNDGINIAAREGAPVWAAASGEVVYAGNELAGYGNMVLIKHRGGKTTAYAHLSKIAVDKYARVKQGDVIGYVGETGGVKEPQLHFAIRDSNKHPLDPEKYLN